VIKAFIKDLLLCIFVVLLLLGACAGVDYADNNINCTIDNIGGCNVSVNDTSKVLLVNESAHTIVHKSSDKIYTKHSLIGMYAKPSCGCRYSYTWHYREFVNYCPNCGHYGTLRCNPKGVPEREYTCCRCSSDFCGVCGKEKYSWSRVYLTRA